ncbi:hypothetical protein [Fulvivirga ligni]|uniref:hypothetical protein n=1 Tax=Fulvivirga ligni TaxID=2904246 RepID=UPI001F39C74A|nr:hypothetical protein [Fulvivirga ligni]UII21554.1 hypothetical protein LVD16_27380 [Fulvivirga ligni]
MSNSDLKNYQDFNVPITDLLEGGDAHILTDAAKQLVEGDLVALAWRNITPRTEKLGVRDLQSIEEAFASHSLYGTSKSPVVGASCCCTCTPACCCTAAAVIKAA